MKEKIPSNLPVRHLSERATALHGFISVISIIRCDVGNKPEEKLLNFLITHSLLTSPSNRQSDIPQGTQLPYINTLLRAKES